MQVIDGDITLRFLEGLTSLNGLGSLVSTNGELLLHNLPRLTSTRALTNFTSVGECLSICRTAVAHGPCATVADRLSAAMVAAASITAYQPW
jgi:hypothetical protein